MTLFLGLSVVLLLSMLLIIILLFDCYFLAVASYVSLNIFSEPMIERLMIEPESSRLMGEEFFSFGF